MRARGGREGVNIENIIAVAISLSLANKPGISPLIGRPTFGLLGLVGADGHARGVGDVLRQAREVLVVEVRRELQVVSRGEGVVRSRQVLHGATVAAPVHVPAGVRLRPQVVQGDTHFLRLRLAIRREERRTGQV